MVYNFYKGLLGKFTRWSYQLCAHIAPKHKTLMLCDYTYEPDDFPQQGIQYFIKGLDKPYTEITNGYDPAKWYCTKEKEKNTFGSTNHPHPDRYHNGQQHCEIWTCLPKGKQAARR